MTDKKKFTDIICEGLEEKIKFLKEKYNLTE
jgi:hypothetical protein